MYVFLTGSRRSSQLRRKKDHTLLDVTLARPTVLEAAVVGPNFEFGWYLNDTIVPVVSLATQDGEMVAEDIIYAAALSSDPWKQYESEVALVMTEPSNVHDSVRQAWASDATAAVYYGKSRTTRKNNKHRHHRIDSWINAVPAIEVGRSAGEQLVDTIRLAMASLPDDHGVALRMRQVQEPPLDSQPPPGAMPVKQVRGGLLGAIVISAALMLVLAMFVVFQLVAYWQKRSLFRSVRRGEVNIEELGIKRVKVPRSVVDKFLPVETFLPRSSKNTLKYDQEECPICLEEYHAQCQIRVLPCMHYYHPKCIDRYLQSRSSLCPLCKRSCLPKGYLPPGVKITYATVRRAKRLARLRRAASGGPTRWQRLVLLMGGGGRTTSSRDVELGDRRRRSSGLPNLAALQELQRVPTQEEEDEAYRRLPWYVKLKDAIFPV